MFNNLKSHFSSKFVSKAENQFLNIIAFLEENNFKVEYRKVNDNTTWFKCFPFACKYSLDIHVTAKRRNDYSIHLTIYQNGILKYHETCQQFDDLVKYDLTLKMLKCKVLDHLLYNKVSFDFKNLDYIFNYFWFDKKFRHFDVFVSNDNEVQLCSYNNGFCYEVTIYNDGTISFVVDDYANDSDSELEYDNYDLTIDDIISEMNDYFKQVHY